MGKKTKKKNRKVINKDNKKNAVSADDVVESKKVVNKPIKKSKRKKESLEKLPEEPSNRLFWRKFRWPMIGIGVFLIFCFLVLGGFYGFRVFMGGKTMIGTSVAGIDVSMMGREEVKKKLQNEVYKFSKNPLIVVLEGNKEKIILKNLGVSVDFDKTVDQLVYMKNDLETSFVLKSFVFNDQYNLVLNFRHDKALARLESVFELDALRAKNATLLLDEKKKIKILEGKAGKKLDYEVFAKDLDSNVKLLSGEAIELKLNEELPSVVKADLEMSRKQLEEKMKQVLVLKRGSNKWKIPLLDRLDWIQFKKIDGDSHHQVSKNLVVGFNFKIDLVDSLVEDYLKKEVVAKVELPVKKVSITKDGKGKIVFNGRPQNGQVLKLKESIEVMEKAINEGKANVDLVMKEIKAPVEVKNDSLKDLGINNLLATGYTTYYGSPYNRIHNISIGISRYNGEMILPGESFSFNAHLGSVDAKSGYRPELVIKGNKTIPEYGGGLCQVSTTFYRAALYSGLPIEKRAPHSYAVGYYAQVKGHGLDATIYPEAGKDVIIKNDTLGNILIQSYAENGAAYFHFYGTDDGRSVKMEGPYLGGYHGPGPATIEETAALPAGVKRKVSGAHTGFNATWFRHLKKADGTVVKEPIISNYKAVKAKYLVGKSAVAVEVSTPTP